MIVGVSGEFCAIVTDVCRAWWHEVAKSKAMTAKRNKMEDAQKGPLLICVVAMQFECVCHIFGRLFECLGMVSAGANGGYIGNFIMAGVPHFRAEMGNFAFADWIDGRLQPMNCYVLARSLFYLVTVGMNNDHDTGRWKSRVQVFQAIRNYCTARG
jgi:hypothetical protein